MVVINIIGYHDFNSLKLDMEIDRYALEAGIEGLTIDYSSPRRPIC